MERVMKAPGFVTAGLSSAVLLLAAMALSAYPAGGAAAPARDRGVEELVLAPLLQVGHGPEHVTRSMGEVLSSEVREVVGPEGKATGTEIHALAGDGWEAEICLASWPAVERAFSLSSFALSRPSPALDLPVAPGDSRKEVERILGPPAAARKPGKLEYRFPLRDSPYHVAVIELESGSVTRIRWAFGLGHEDPCAGAHGASRPTRVEPSSK